MPLHAWEPARLADPCRPIEAGDRPIRIALLRAQTRAATAHLARVRAQVAALRRSAARRAPEAPDPMS